MSWLRKLALWKLASGGKVDPIEAARDNLLNKAGKVDLAQQAVLLGNLAEIARDDVDAVRRLRAKHLGPEFAMSGKGGDDDVGDIIVCDDYHRDQPPPRQPSRAWPMAAGLAMGGGLIGLALSLPTLLDRLAPRPTAEPKGAPAAGGSTTTIRRGFVIDLPGAKEPP